MDTLLLVSAISFLAIYGSVFWLIILLESKDGVHEDPEPDEYPSVSVLIPAYNEEDCIAETVESALAIDYPGRVEVIAINDGSADNTLEVLKPYAERDEIMLVDKENTGKADSLNQVLEDVDTDLFASLDADSSVKPDALHYMVGYLKDPKVAAVTPSMKVKEPDTFVQKLQWIEYLTSILMRKMSAVLDVITVTPGPFTVYRTDVIRDIGKYDTDTLTEDMEIAYKLHNYGYKIENSLNAETYTYAPENMRQLFKQRIRWTRGSYQNLWKYSHMLLNKKYGTIGFYFLPFSVAMIFLAPFAFGFAVYSLLNAVQSWLTSFYDALVYGFSFDPLAFLFTLNGYYLTVGGLVIAIGLTILYASHKISGEKIAFSEKISYVTYIFLYLIFLNMMWIISFFEETLGVSRKW